MERNDFWSKGNFAQSMSKEDMEEKTKTIHNRYDEDKNIVFNELPCPFLNENKCAMYESRPKDCKSFPHLNQDITVRCHQFFGNAKTCPIAFNVLQNAKLEFEEQIYKFENQEV